MISFSIPRFKDLHFQYLVLDFNGTLAADGKLLKGVAEKLNALSELLEVHVITADTFGKAKEQLENIKCNLKIISENDQTLQKLDYITKLGTDNVVAIGNGRNDQLMLKHASLGIALIQKEGASTETLLASDIICTDILDALDLLTNNKRLIATLRS